MPQLNGITKLEQKKVEQQAGINKKQIEDVM
jgi:hypothetical protein